MTASTAHKPGSREVNVRCAEELMDCMRGKGYGSEDIFYKHNAVGTVLAKSLGCRSHKPLDYYAELNIEGEFNLLLRLHNIDPRHTAFPITKVKYNGTFSGYVVEYISGENLSEYEMVRSPTKLDMLKILGQYYDIIEGYHANGEAHVDPSKKNVIIVTTAEGPRVVMIDPSPVLLGELSQGRHRDGNIMRDLRHEIEFTHGIRPGELELFRRSTQGTFQLAEPRFESGP